MLRTCSAIRVIRPLNGRLLVLPEGSCLPRRRPIIATQSCARRFTSTSSAAIGHGDAVASQSGLAIFAPLTNELDRMCPRFEIEADDVEILRGPVEFYEALKTKILKAQHRVYLSTLYIGKTEHELIATLRIALLRNKELKVSVLTDALRGTRETPRPTTASLLAPLISEFGSARVKIKLYHTPNLTGLRKKWIPVRINEGWGLQHMKLYGIDDEIILSGANLSSDYFTNRQDRYHVFRSKAVTDYYHRIHSAISSISFDVQPSLDQADYSMSWPASSVCPSPLHDARGYISHASSLLGPLISPPPTAQSQPAKCSTSTKTLLYPLVQFTPLLPADAASSSSGPKSTELPTLTHLLTTIRSPPFTSSTVTFTAGYFNPSAHLTNLLLTSHATRLDVIGASPEANGFYGSKGVSGMLPAAYTLLAKRFLEATMRAGLDEKTRVLEWKRGMVGKEGGWTYHAKGLWVTLPSASAPAADAKTGGEAAGPSITIIGSSNYTTRAHTLDLEANALVITCDEGLQRKLRREEEWLKEDAKEVGIEEFRRTERRVSVWVRISMWIVGAVGGAL